jgi:hypothetical protein
MARQTAARPQLPSRPSVDLPVKWSPSWCSGMHVLGKVRVQMQLSGAIEPQAFAAGVQLRDAECLHGREVRPLSYPQIGVADAQKTLWDRKAHHSPVWDDRTPRRSRSPLPLRMSLMERPRSAQDFPTAESVVGSSASIAGGFRSLQRPGCLNQTSVTQAQPHR